LECELETVLQFLKKYDNKAEGRQMCHAKGTKMKKFTLNIGIIVTMLFLTACKNNKGTDAGDINQEPTTTPVVTATPTDVPTESTDNTKEEPTTLLTIADYFPFKEDAEYVYEGEGNEYASYVVYTDYVKEDSIQLRKSDSGAEVVTVLKYEKGELTKVLSREEAYYRENFIGKTEGEAEILLKEPLKQGTEWTIQGNHKRYISNVGVDITTPSGDYEALEVTTDEEGGEKVDYYAPGVGLVKTIYSGKDYQVTSTLSKINANTPFKQTISIYYPTVEEVIRVENKELSFNTNDITRIKLEEAVKNITKEDDRPLISTNTRINSLYLSKDNVVNVDFSRELITEMNAGAGYEALILQSIANTLGDYYGVNEVYITIDGNPYESGHILLKKGETFKVNYDKVKK
jgi:hypothetical protein